MSSKNLWGDLSDLETVRTPQAILHEQAGYLTEATESALVGKVEVRNIVSSDFCYDLDVLVPALNNYTYTILTISHSVNLYPVRVHAGAKGISSRCENEEEFEETVAQILSSKEVKRILSRLLSQAVSN